MAGAGPYLWINKYSPAAGFHRVPPGGMCIGVFLFVRRGRMLLLGKVREHPKWRALAGEENARMAGDAAGWKIPARQLRLGEDPRDAARQIGEEMLGMPGLTYHEPRIEVEFWKLGAQASGPPARRKMFHYDMWFMVDASAPAGSAPRTPPWFSELAWFSAKAASQVKWSRFHGDVWARWAKKRPDRFR